MGIKNILKLIIAIIVIIAIVIVAVMVCNKLWKKNKLEDLRTNLLLIQGKAKSYTEDVSVETANLSEEKEEESTKIEEVKGEKLKGTLLPNCSDEIKQAAEQTKIENMDEFYYLSQQDLKDMGINIKEEDGTYYLVKYDFEDTEVVYTKGYEYNDKTYYKLSDIADIQM